MAFKHHHHSPIGSWLVRNRIARNIKEANVYLMIFSVCIFFLSAYIAFLPQQHNTTASFVERYTNKY
jgi:hypothetical protein